ncbi:type 4a pilus biogenesis protein PilO [Deinococcus multiflagellatus]|uniref:type 4a pilus biogenesis protein PilO n=1 Tax=Deinococcus multiflagellatus TaxID=1656887 RepID=UPI001CCDB5D7|nr:type 4a pilus biogenesis protein PilO [Deinococcus multiflagellatus]MBZ9714403.1 type 4a pilus biogenesis protein PilO [Deinococcus multiflagellatus]
MTASTQRLALLALIVLLGGWLTFTQVRHYLSAREALIQAQILQTETQTRADQLPIEEARAKTLATEAQDLNAVLPEREQLGGLLRELRLLAAQHGLRVKGINRQAATSPLPGITAISLAMTLDGTYPGLQAYLDALGALDRAVTVTRGVLSRTADNLDVSLQIVAYARNIPPAPTPAPTTALPPTGAP